MRVVAIRKGFFGQTIEAGQEFDVPEGTKGSWFQPVGKGESKGETAGAKAGKSSTTTAQVDAVTKNTK